MESFHEFEARMHEAVSGWGWEQYLLLILALSFCVWLLHYAMNILSIGRIERTRDDPRLARIIGWPAVFSPHDFLRGLQILRLVITLYAFTYAISILAMLMGYVHGLWLVIPMVGIGLYGRILGSVTNLAILALCVASRKPPEQIESAAAFVTFTVGPVILLWCLAIFVRRKRMYDVGEKTVIEVARRLLPVVKLARSSFESYDISPSLKTANDQIDRLVERYKMRIPERVQKKISNDVYIAAVKSIVPKKTWRADFSALLGQRYDDVIDSASFADDVSAIREECLEDIRRQAGGDAAIEMPAHDELVLRHFAHGDMTLDKLLDPADPLRQVVNVQIEGRDIAIGGAVAASGLVILGMLELMGPVATAHLIGDFMVNAALHNEILNGLADKAVNIIIGIIIEEVGAGSVEEVLTWLGAVVLPVVGQAIVGWRVLRYSHVVYRLLVKKQPLQQIRQRVTDACTKATEQLGDEAKSRVRESAEQFQVRLLEKLDDIQQSCQRRVARAA